MCAPTMSCRWRKRSPRFRKANATRYLPATRKTTTPRLISIGISGGAPSNWRRPGTWYNWRILAGRGFGNTRTGAEWVWCKHGAVPQLSLVNIPPVSGDCRVAAEVGRIERGPKAPEVVETTGYLEWGVRRMGRRGRLEGYAA